MNFFKRIFQKNNNLLNLVPAPSASEVEDYYDRETESYLKTYGNIFQANRPASDEELANYFIKSMDIRDGMKLLDAGCGVCGPSILFAKMKDVTIDAITLSQNQVNIALENIKKENLETKINVRKGDFSCLDSIYPSNRYDIVFFLESLGYSPELYSVIKGVSDLLKSGGFLYIKDYLLVPLTDETQLAKQLETTLDVRREYNYKMIDLVNLLSIVREFGLRLEFIRKLGYIRENTRSILFEKMNDRHKIYTKTLSNTFQLFETFEFMFRKP